MGIPRTTALLLLLFLIIFAACNDTCYRLNSLDDFLSCPALCDGNPATSVDCYSGIPVFPSGAFWSGHERLTEITIYSIAPGMNDWLIGETDQGTVEILDLPVSGVTTTRPGPRLRSSDQVPEGSESKMSLYYRWSTGTQSCVLEIGSVMTWELPSFGFPYFTEHFERSSFVMRKNGNCLGTSYQDIQPGFSAKEMGIIIRLIEIDWGQGGYGDGPNACIPDDWCNPDCETDPDCDCHGDGICDPFECPNDEDCLCAEDSECNPECDDDPDCACIEDGVCNPDCGYLDSDCLCAQDDYCNCDCIREDPDCGCLADGECSKICGWADEDCLCIEEGICNPDCESDPDCEEE